MQPSRALMSVFLAGLLIAPAAGAQVAAPARGADGVVDMDTVVVSGAQPGPGMWKVTSGENAMWVLGTLSPLPRRMTWLSRDVEAVIGQAQEVIQPPGITVTSDMGRFRSLLLIPSLLRARKNPEGRPLDEVLPADLHARWTLLKLRYLGRGRKFDNWRPVFAGYKLYEAALKDAGLDDRNVVAPVVAKAAKRHSLKVTSPLVTLKIEQPKQVIREFSESSLGDVTCFARTLARVENDLGTMATRANAWSTGDIDALRALPYEDQSRACLDSLLQTDIARKRGLVDMEQRVQSAWIAAAEKSLKANRVTFATLPVSVLLRPDGYLATLAAKGYTVEEP